MNITLNDFVTISNGTHNVGQIKLTQDKSGLEKINNHVWKTRENNVQTSASENAAVRQALFDAFSQSDKKFSIGILQQIKTILLDQGNSSRSLSRDFVKKLIDTVGKAHDGDDIVGKMDVVSKSLCNRSVSVAGAKGLVTSSKAAAYTIYASEAMDVAVNTVLDGFKEIANAKSNRVDNPDADVRRGFEYAIDHVMTGFKDLIDTDQRLVNDKRAERMKNALSSLAKDFATIVTEDNVSIIGADREVVARYNNSIRKYGFDNSDFLGKKYAADLISSRLENAIRALYAEQLGDSIAEDHLMRVFSASGRNLANFDRIGRASAGLAKQVVEFYQSTDDSLSEKRDMLTKSIKDLYVLSLQSVIATVRKNNSIEETFKRKLINSLESNKDLDNAAKVYLEKIDNLFDYQKNGNSSEDRAVIEIKTKTCNNILSAIEVSFEEAYEAATDERNVQSLPDGIATILDDCKSLFVLAFQPAGNN